MQNRVHLHLARHQLLPHRQPPNIRPIEAALIERLHLAAQRGAVHQANQTQSAVEPVGVARHDAFKQPVEWARLMLIGVLIGQQQRRHHGHADGHHIGHRRIALGPIARLLVSRRQDG